MNTERISAAARCAQAHPTIPDIRERLHELAAELRDPVGLAYKDIADEIDELADKSYRRFGGRRAKPKRSKLTDELKAQIVACANEHPDWNYDQIARHCGTTSGRVSEALTGFRG
jgi:hypothetical protein